jgi:hypothetical protein
MLAKRREAAIDRHSRLRATAQRHDSQKRDANDKV